MVVPGASGGLTWSTLRNRPASCSQGQDAGVQFKLESTGRVPWMYDPTLSGVLVAARVRARSDHPERELVSVPSLGHPFDGCQGCPAVTQGRVVGALQLVPRVVLLRDIPNTGELRILEHCAVPGGWPQGRQAIPRAGLVEDPAVEGGVVNHHKPLLEERNEARIQFAEAGRVRHGDRIEVMDCSSCCGSWTLWTNERIEEHLALGRE